MCDDVIMQITIDWRYDKSNIFTNYTRYHIYLKKIFTETKLMS